MPITERLSDVLRDAGIALGEPEGSAAARLVDAAAFRVAMDGRTGSAEVAPGAVLVWHESACFPGRVWRGLLVRPDACVEAVAARVLEDSGLSLAEARGVIESVRGRGTACAQGAARLFAALIDELGRAHEESEAFDSATEAVDQAYEVIDLLHNLGSAMSDPMRQSALVGMAVDELRETLGFGWVAAVVDPERARQVGLEGATVCSAHAEVDEDAVRAALRARCVMGAWPAEGSVQRWGEAGTLLGRFTVLEPILVEGVPAGVLVAGGKRPGAPEVSSFDRRLLQSAASYIGPMMRVAELFEQQQRLFLGTVRALTSSVDAKDPYTRGHSERVAHLAARLAGAMGWDEARVERVRLAGLLHDVGKIGVPERVLRKPGRLSDEEFAEIRRHPEVGHRILRDVPGLEDVLGGVLSHHERWDGRGYPHGLAGEEIPVVARMLGLADTFDAMSSNRAYRPGLPRERVLGEIARCAGTQFDPTLAPVFVGLDFAEYDRLVASAAAQEAYREAA